MEFEVITAEAGQEQIQQLLGCTFETFTNVAIVAQQSRGRNVTDFIDCTDSERKELFQAIFGLEGYSQAYELAHTDLGTRNKELVTLDLDEARSRVRFEEKVNTLEAKKAEHANKISWYDETLKALTEKCLNVSVELRATVVPPEPVDLTAERDRVQNELSQAKSELEALEAFHRSTSRTYTTKNASVEVLQREIVRLEGLEPTKPENYDLRGEIEAQVKVFEEEIETLREFERNEVIKREGLQATNSANTLQIVELENQLQAIRGDIDQLKTLQTELTAEKERIESSVCPTCSQSLPEETRESLLEGFRNRLTDLEVQRLRLGQLETVVGANLAVQKEQATIYTHQLRESIDQLEAIRQAIGERATKTLNEQLRAFGIYDSLLIQVGALQSKRDQLTEIESEISELKAVLAAEGSKISGLAPKIGVLGKLLDDVNRRLNEALKIRSTISAERNTKASAIARIEGELAALQLPMFAPASLTEEIEDLKKSYESILEQRELVLQSVKVLEALKKAFSPEGIIAELFREYIPAIESRSQEYLQGLTDGELQISFSSDTELKKGGSKAKLDISAWNTTGGNSYDVLSGSEQNKIALSTSLALADVANQHTNLRLNLRVFDEVFDSLDAKGMSRLATLLGAVDGQTVFIITHKVELEDSFQNRIVLHKNASGVSSLLEIQE